MVYTLGESVADASQGECGGSSRKGGSRCELGGVWRKQHMDLEVRTAVYQVVASFTGNCTLMVGLLGNEDSEEGWLNTAKW